MGKRQTGAVILGVMMLAGAVTGCGSPAEQVKETETAVVGEKAASAEDTASQTGEMRQKDGEPGGRRQGNGGTVVQITAIDGDTITAAVGELRPGKPDGVQEPPAGDKPDGAQEPPARDKSDGAQEPPVGDKPDHPGKEDMRHPSDDRKGSRGGPRGGEFTATEGTLTFTLTDETAVVAETMKGSEDVTAAELAVGDVLEVTFDDNDQPLTVIVRYMDQNAEGESGENAADAETEAEN